MKCSSNFVDAQSLGEHTLGYHMFLLKAENHCVIVLILKKALGLGEQSVAQHVRVLLRIME